MPKNKDSKKNIWFSATVEIKSTEKATTHQNHEILEKLI